MPEMTIVDAVNLALARAMEEDETVVLLGQDIGVNGGVFRATNGLAQRFGGARVLDTPISESAIIGASVGMSSQGLRPVAEIQFMGFLYAGLDQLLTQAGRMRNRTRGRLTCPMVVRTPFGGGIRAPEYHADSIEAILAHSPGLRILVPSSPKRAYGLLLAAIRDPDPVVFMEPMRLYRAIKEEVEDDGIALPLDKCFVLREGDDLTLITWGATVPQTLQAADALQGEGIAAHVIDVASIARLDMETIFESVKQTGRCVIIHEAAKTAGFGGEIAARLADDGLFSLQAPIKRIAGYDTVFPLYRLENAYMPTTERILDACRDVLSY
jgi:2-oxoisovalerate dehydrogenase E1 component beta subunit